MGLGVVPLVTFIVVVEEVVLGFEASADDVADFWAVR
jgi:hypothetical protein